MTRIAICCGSASLQRQALAMLKTYLDRRGDSEGRADAYNSVPELLESMGSGMDYDLYIFEALMPGLSGADLCVRLRELGGRGAILRLTYAGERPPESFKDQAIGRLMKPLKKDAVFKELDRVLDWIDQRMSASVTMTSRGGTRAMPMEELLYVDLINRVLRYHKPDGSIAASVTLRSSFQKAAAPLLSDGRFFRCGTSFAVNLHHVRGVNQDSLLMDNGATVPLTRGMFGEARRRWASYWRGDPMAEAAAS